MKFNLSNYSSGSCMNVVNLCSLTMAQLKTQLYIEVHANTLEFAIFNIKSRCYITSLPKGDNARQLLKNWRPLFLLFTLYMLASGVLAERMKP